jgi:hypothetical protein
MAFLVDQEKMGQIARSVLYKLHDLYLGVLVSFIYTSG